MSSVSCGPLPHRLYEKYLLPPLDEGCHQLSYVYSMEGRSILALAERVGHAIGGVLLMLPLINLVALRIFQGAGLTMGQAFQKAVEEGDEAGVKSYLKSGFSPDMVCVDGNPILYHAHPNVVRTLLTEGADPTVLKSDDALFLEHLVKKNYVDLATAVVKSYVDLATALVDEGLVDLAPYLTQDVFEGARDHKGYRTFLLHMGYNASFEERAGLDFHSKTALPLEVLIMSGGTVGVEGLVIADVDRDLEQIQRALPRLQVGQIWTSMLKAQIKKAFDGAAIRTLLGKGAEPDEQFLLQLVKLGQMEFAKKLAEEEIVAVTPYLTPEIFESVKDNQRCRTFLLHMGYDASLEERQGLTYEFETAMMLERYIMTGNVDGLKSLHLDTIEEHLRILHVLLPHIETQWIWTHVLQGCFFNEKEWTPEIVMKLLRKGAKIDPLQELFAGTPLLEALIDNGRVGLARELVLNGFVSMANYFHKDFLKMDGGKVTLVSKEVVWFLIEMGYEGEVRPHIDGDTYISGRAGNNSLEKAIFTCNRDGVKSLSLNRSLQEFLCDYRSLKKVCPRLNASWIWDVVADAYWKAHKYDDFRHLVEQGYYQPSDAFFTANKWIMSTTAKVTLVRVGYRGKPLFDRDANLNPNFSTLTCSRDVEGMRNYFKDVGFQKFYNDFATFKGSYPKAYTSWIWDAIFSIPNTHYTQFKPLEEDQPVTEPPPGRADIQELETLYDKIDFSKFSKRELSDTLGARRVHDKQSLRRGLNKLLGPWNSNTVAYAVGDADTARHRLELRWIVYYLKQDLGLNAHLSHEKARMFTDMLMECLYCHSNWNDVFPRTRKRMGGIESCVVTFEDQVQTVFSDFRSRILTHLAKANPHTLENLIGSLKGPRALVEPVSRGRFRHGTYGDFDSASRAFDALYTPGEMIEASIELAGSGGDFYNLLLDNLAAMASQWHGQDGALRTAIQGRESERLTYEELQGLGIAVPRETVTFDSVWEHLPTLNWGPFVTFPIGTLNDADAIAAHKVTFKQSLKDKWIEIGEEHEVNLQGLSPRQFIPKLFAKITPIQRRDLTADCNIMQSDAVSPLEVKHFMEKRSEHLQCSDQTLADFYAAHPEIPESLRKGELLGQKLNTPEVKRHLMSLALDLKYAIAPLECGVYLEREEQGVFREVAVPMKDDGELTLKGGGIHPLVVGKLLMDMGHLGAREPAVFNRVFTRG